MNNSVKDIKHFLDTQLPNVTVLGNKAARLVQEKEGEFLALGQAIQDVKQKCVACQETVVSLTDILSGERMGESSARMSREFKQMRNIFTHGKFSKVIEQVQDQKERISRFVASEREFKRVVKRLGMLGISTRIESARLGEEGRNFGSLAVDVESLASKIVNDAKEIKTTGLRLEEQIDVVISEVLDIDQSRGAIIKDLFSGLQENIDEMDRMRKESLKLAESMEETAKSIANDVSAIVSSMQFHDITRQQLEHVQHVLDESKEEVKAALEEEPEPDVLQDLVAYLGDVCQLQAGQMRNSHKELNRAFNVLQDKFSGIEQMVRNITGMVGKSDDEHSGNDSRTLVSKVVSGLQKVADNVEMTGEQNKHINSLMEDIQKNMSDIERFVGQIEEVGSEVELLALNASVKAARTGDNGRALGVIAVAIQQLSYEARGQSASIVEILQKSLQASSELADETEKAFDLKEINAVNDALMSLVADMRDMDNQSAALQKDIHAYANEVLDLINAVQENLEENRSILPDLEELYLELEQVASESGEIVPNITGEHSPRLQDLLSRYTMESERMVHDMLSGLERIGDGPADDGQDDGVSEDSDDDWDNVELF